MTEPDGEGVDGALTVTTGPEGPQEGETVLAIDGTASPPVLGSALTFDNGWVDLGRIDDSGITERPMWYQYTSNLMWSGGTTSYTVPTYNYTTSTTTMITWPTWTYATAYGTTNNINIHNIHQHEAGLYDWDAQQQPLRSMEDATSPVQGPISVEENVRRAVRRNQEELRREREAERLEWIGRNQWIERERQAHTPNAAERRAEELLLSLLDARQLESYRLHGEFEVMGSAGGHYRIKRGTMGNIEWIRPDGQRGGTLCVHPTTRHGVLPMRDVHLAQLLALTTDEVGFLNLANVHTGQRPAHLPPRVRVGA